MTDVPPDLVPPPAPPMFPGWYPLLVKAWVRFAKAITAIVFAAQAVFLAQYPDASGPAQAAATAIGLAVIALLTESRAGVAEKVEVARYTGAIEEQAIAPLRAAVAKQQAKNP